MATDLRSYAERRLAEIEQNLDQISGGTSSTLYSAEATNIATTETQLHPGSQATTEIIVQAKHANSATIMVGVAGAQFYELLAGESIVLPLDNMNKVYARSASGTQGANLVGR